MLISNEFKSRVFLHRGMHDNVVPENSLLAFKRCTEIGVNIELDVHVLRDSQVVVFHDSNLKRMTGIDKKITACTYEEIKLLKLKNSNERIPLLIDVLKLVNNKVTIAIEIKTDTKKTDIKKVLKLLTGYSNIVLSSFNYLIVRYAKKHTNYSVGLITLKLFKPNSKLFKLKNKVTSIILNLSYLRPDFVCPQLTELPSKTIVKFRHNGGYVAIWDIKNEFDFAKAKQYGDMFIIEQIKR